MPKETTIRERFEKKFVRDDGLMDKYVSVEDLASELGFTTITTGDAILSFLKQELTGMVEEIEEIIVDAEGLSKFVIGSVELHTTIGGNAGSRSAASIIKSKIQEL